MLPKSTPSHLYVVGCGSNLGDRAGQLAVAASRVGALGTLLRQTPLYETAPLGAADRSFLNGAWLLETTLPPPELLGALLSIEAELGRVRTVRWGNRIIDLDVLLWGDGTRGIVTTYVDSGLTIPHPRIAERRFVLEPLNEISPDYLHPVLGKTISWLLQECTDELAVKKII